MSYLSRREEETLRQICGTFVPQLAAQSGEDERLFAASAQDTNLAEQLSAVVSEIAGKDGRARLKRVLALFESRLVNCLVAGRFCPISRGTLDERTNILRAWGNSRLPWARTAFNGIKRLALFLHYSDADEQGANRAWPVFEYAPPLSPGSGTGARPLQMLELGPGDSLHADVLVIGSGAGGGVAAAEFAAAGFDVLVVEKGEYFHGVEFAPSERLGMSRLYERRGSLATADLSAVVLAGSALGGGTTVNWMTCLAPPEYVLEEWAGQFGFREALSRELEASIAAVGRRLGVSTQESQCNPQNAALERGCRELGYRVATIPRNVRNCRECDFCGFGCSHGAKQDTRQTYLLDAQSHGARILPKAHAERVLHTAGKVVGAEVLARDAQGQTRRITVRAPLVVAAGGAIHTPALLLRSGLANHNLGRHLHLHPTTATYARFAEPIQSWQGVPQSRYCDEFADLDGRGHGVRLETAPAHPGLWALALGWQSPRDHKRRMQSLAHLANIIVLTRDRHAGRVSLDRRGEPRLDYALHAYDAQHLIRGALAALRVHRAAGALEVSSPHYETLVFRGQTETEFERFLQDVERASFAPNRFGLFSAHQLSSCRLAASPRQGVVNPAGETYEVKNLLVADGSLLPTACGVNPMLTIMGLVHFLAQGWKHRRP